MSNTKWYKLDFYKLIYKIKNNLSYVFKRI